MGHSDIFSAFLILTISLTFVTTALSRFKIPSIVGFIITGIVIGPSGLNWINSVPAVETISEIGIIFLMFSLGLEISFTELKKLAKPLITIGAAQVLITIFLVTVFITVFFNVSIKTSFIYGALLALSSTAVILKLLQENRETESPHGRASVIILLFQDIMALPLMISIPLIASNSPGTNDWIKISTEFAKIITYFLVCFLFGNFLVPKIFTQVVRTRSREVFFFLLISFTLIISFFAEQVGLSMSLGAFVAGVLISESQFNKQALAEFTPLRDVFLGLFFASIGLLLDIKFVADKFFILTAIILLLFVIKFFIIYFIMKANKQSHGISLATALGLSQIGEFSFVIATSAKGYGLIANIEFQYFLAVAVLSLIFTPVMFSYALKSTTHINWPELKKLLLEKNSNLNQKIEAVQIKEIEKSPIKPRSAIVIGLGHGGQTALKSLKENNIPCIGIDLNINLLDEVKTLGIPTIFGDATRPEVLEAANICDAHLVIITVNSKHLAAQIQSVVIQHAPQANILIRVQYILDMNLLKQREKDSIIIAESETSNAISTKVLAYYDFANIN